MTEKRFTYMIDRVFDLWEVYDNKEKVICLVRNIDAKDLCDLLNELNDENNELKKEVKQLKNKIKTYNNTHELLKKTIDRLRSDG